MANESHHDLSTRQHLPSPVFCDWRKQLTFNGIPFTRSRRIVAKMKRNAQLGGQGLELNSPQSPIRSITPPTISDDEQRSRRRLRLSTTLIPPRSNRIHRKFCCIRTHPDIHKAFVSSDVVNAVRCDFPQSFVNKIVDFCLRRLTMVIVLTARIGVVSYLLLLLRIHRNDWPPMP